MNRCKLCGLPEYEHYYDRCAWGCRAFDGVGDHPARRAMKSRDTICTMGQDKLVKFVGVVAIIAVVAILLCGCERDPTEEDMAVACASHRSPTWGDVARCEAADSARHEGAVK